MLEWNVYVGNFNAKKIETHNVFHHTGFVEDCRKAAKKFKDDKAAFAEEVRLSLMYYYWTKCEWEVIISHWPPMKGKGWDYALKIDVYGQVMMNWDRFIDYLWENRKELTKKVK